MRSTALLAMTVLLALVGASCDTTQPLQADPQFLELRVDASDVSNAAFFDVYDGTSDCNNDGLPDDDDMDGEPDTFLWCLTRTGPLPTGTTQGFPWNFTVEVTIVRSTSTEREALTSELARDSFELSITPSDTRTQWTVEPPGPLPPIFESGCRFDFANPRVRTTVFRDVLASTSNPISTLNPIDYGTKGSGLCSNSDPGGPVIDAITSGDTFPFPIALGKGDSITVKIVRDDEAPDGIDDVAGVGPGISANLVLNDQNLQVDGQTSATAQNSSFSFNYTSR